MAAAWSLFEVTVAEPTFGACQPTTFRSGDRFSLGRPAQRTADRGALGQSCFDPRQSRFQGIQGVQDGIYEVRRDQITGLEMLKLLCHVYDLPQSKRCALAGPGRG